MPEIGHVVPPLNGEVFGWLADHGAKPSGPPFWKYNVIDMERHLEIEAGVAVEQPLPGDGRVLAGMLPGGSYATLVHTVIRTSCSMQPRPCSTGARRRA